MRFSTIIFKNLLHRPVRTGLTVVGLSVAISAVVTLSGIAWGFERSFLSLYDAKGIDLIVVRAGISSQLSSNLSESLAEPLRAMPGVAQVARSLVDTLSFEEAHLVGVVINGWEPEGLLKKGLKLLSGEMLDPRANRQVMLGRVLSLSLDRKPGDDLAIAGEKFRVVGVFDSTSPFETGSAIVNIATLQQMMGREHQVTAFLISTQFPNDPTKVRALGKTIEQQLSGVAAITARDFVAQDLQINLARAMAWVTSLVALVIGSIGVLNTMAMSVFERTAEIGTLRALGWKRRRILGLILGESLVLGLLGAILGTTMGFVSVRLIMFSPTSRNFIDPNLPPEVAALGLSLGLSLSLVGGLYPAIRAASMRPTEALRHD